MVGDGTFERVGWAAATRDTLREIPVEPPGEIELRHLLPRRLLQGPHIGQPRGSRLDDRSLVSRGQEAIGEVVEATRRDQSAVDHHVAGQFVVLATEAVGRPCSHARTPLQARAGVEKIVGVGVLGEFARHRADDRQFIDDRAHVRKQIAHRDAALPVWLKLPRARQHPADVVELRGIDLEERVRVLAGMLLERGLRIEAVNLRHAAIHIEKDHARRPAWMVQARQNTGRGRPGRVASHERRVASQQRRRRHGSESAAARTEHLPAGQGPGPAATAVLARLAHGTKMNSLVVINAWARSAQVDSCRGWPAKDTP